MLKLPILFAGLDLAMNHSGIVFLDEQGKVFYSFFISTVKKHIITIDDGFIKAIHLRPQRKSENIENYQAFKCHFAVANVELLFNKFTTLNIVYAGIEDYSYNSMGRSLVQIAEIDGLIKNFLWNSRIPFKRISPKSLKLMGGKRGNAKKKDIIDNVKAEFPLVINDAILQWDNKTKDYKGPATDLADAFVLAKIVQYDYLLNNSKLSKDNLTDYEKRALYEVSKITHTSLVDKAYIIKDNNDEQENG